MAVDILTCDRGANMWPGEVLTCVWGRCLHVAMERCLHVAGGGVNMWPWGRC